MSMEKTGLIGSSKANGTPTYLSGRTKGPCRAKSEVAKLFTKEVVAGIQEKMAILLAAGKTGQVAAWIERLRDGPCDIPFIHEGDWDAQVLAGTVCVHIAAGNIDVAAEVFERRRPSFELSLKARD